MMMFTLLDPSVNEWFGDKQLRPQLFPNVCAVVHKNILPTVLLEAGEFVAISLKDRIRKMS